MLASDSLSSRLLSDVRDAAWGSEVLRDLGSQTTLGAALKQAVGSGMTGTGQISGLTAPFIFTRVYFVSKYKEK